MAKKKRDKKRPRSTPYLVFSAVVVLALTLALPIVPGAGNSTGVLMLSTLVVLAALFSPSPLGWVIVLISLGVAAGAGA